MTVYNLLEMNKPVNTRIFFLAILFATCLAAAYVLSAYLSVITLALVFSILVYPWYSFLQRKLKLGQHLASATSILGAFVLVITPLSFIVRHLINELFKIRTTLAVTLSGTSNLQLLATRINESLSWFPALNYTVTVHDLKTIVSDLAKPTSGYLLNTLVNIGSSGANFIAELLMFIILVFALIPILPKLREYLEAISPLEDTMDETYLRRASSMTRSVVEGTFIVAVAQGLLGGLFAWIAGFDYIVSLTLLMIIASIIPIVGTGFITIPLAIYLFMVGHYPQALLMLLGQLFFVSTIDNVIRVFLAPKNNSIHPALLLVSIISGVRLFGMMGLFYGPIIMILCLTSLEIYAKHYARRTLPVLTKTK